MCYVVRVRDKNLELPRVMAIRVSHKPHFVVREFKKIKKHRRNLDIDAITENVKKVAAFGFLHKHLVQSS